METGKPTARKKIMEITKEIVAAAKAFDAEDFGVQYFDENENGVCIGVPDCLSLMDDGSLLFHPQDWPFAGVILADGEMAKEVFSKAVSA